MKKTLFLGGARHLCVPTAWAVISLAGCSSGLSEGGGGGGASEEPASSSGTPDESEPGEDKPGEGKPGAVGSPSKPAAEEAPRELQATFTRLTRAEYTATIRQAFGVEPRLSLIPVDGRIGQFTSNIAATPDPVQPYLFAAEDLGAQLIPAALPACGGSDASDCIRQNYAQPFNALYRRAVTESEISSWATMIAALESSGVSAADATRTMLDAALLNPAFLFRALPLTGDTARARVLAEHLSYALWDAPPDSAALALGDEVNPELGRRLESQVERSIADERAVVVLARFVAQWLRVDTDLKLGEAGFSSSPHYLELLAYVKDALATDAPVTSFVSGTRGFVHRDAREQYGIEPSDDAAEIATVTWPADSSRRGLLAEELFQDDLRHPDPTRSVIFRGRLIRTSLLCDSIPPPPPAAIALAEEVTDRTKDARCQGCHALMDPIGRLFAPLDPDGDVSTQAVEIAGHPELAGAFSDLPSLLDAISESRLFAECFSRQLLAFFLEQALDDADEALVAELADTVQSGGGLADLFVQAMTSVEARSRALVPWCEDR
ncbi:MAG TPA: DUF1588 domain-containing protein [Polyangiaceae bacterium]|nr:DUF1588 domain-containing protein [Polyangiaceae bacterium]